MSLVALHRKTVLALLTLGASAMGQSINAGGNGLGNPGNSFEAGGPTIVPHGTNKVEGQPTAGSTSALSPIINHGGGTMITPTPYLIWYGNWNQNNGSDTAAGQQIVRDFIFGDNDSPYFQINTTYGGPSGLINYAGAAGVHETAVAATGGNLTDNGVANIVANAINSGKLPK